jgi:hypothetical protein
MNPNKHTPTPAQVTTRDRLIAEGYKHVGWREYPSKLKRNPIEAVMVVEKITIAATNSSVRTVLINAKGGEE